MCILHECCIFHCTLNQIHFLTVKTECWRKDADIQVWLKNHSMTEIQLLQQFGNHIVNTVTNAYNLRPIMWEDPFVMGVRIPKHVIIDCWQMWRLPDSLLNPVKAGYDVLMSGCWYLDHLQNDWWKFHSCDPRNGYGLTDEQKPQVLGGHASMWGENVDAVNFFERVWPRASSMAEVLWAGTHPKHDRGLNQELVRDRLSKFRCFLVTQYDVPVSPIFPGFCEAADRIENKPSLFGLKAKGIMAPLATKDGSESMPKYIGIAVAFDGFVAILLVVALALRRHGRDQRVPRLSSRARKNAEKDSDTRTTFCC